VRSQNEKLKETARPDRRVGTPPLAGGQRAARHVPEDFTHIPISLSARRRPAGSRRIASGTVADDAYHRPRRALSSTRCFLAR
jgi:hypothetical protein